MRRLIRALLRPGDSELFSRAMSAGFWATALRFGVRGLMLLRAIVLARLLAPDDFGLMAIATLSILFIENITESGVEPALVQSTDGFDKYLNTAWTMQVLRSLFTASVLVLGAPFIATFFGAPEAQTIVRVLAVGVALKGFTNIGVVRFIKDLSFDRHFVLEMAGKGTEFAVSIGLAIVFRNVWALVIGAMAGVVVRLITSYFIDDYRPRLAWYWPHVKSLFGFGKWVLVSNILYYANNELDDILVGRYLGTSALGLYRMAYNLSQAIAFEVMAITNHVAFPTYAKLQGERDRLRAAYMGTFHIVSFVGFPLALGTVLVAPQMVPVLLGAKWIPMIGALQLLAIGGLFRGLSGTIGPLFLSQGRPEIPPYFAAARLVMMVVMLPPAIQTWELAGAAGVVAITTGITGVAALAFAFWYVRTTPAGLRQAVLFPAFNAVVMAIAVLAAQRVLGDASDLLVLVTSVAVGGIAYVGTVTMASRVLGYDAPSDLIRRVRGAMG